MKFFKAKKQDYPPGIPEPYEEPKPKSLRDFIHGEELVDRLERNRRQRRKWAKDFLGLEHEDWNDD